eukprot:3541788-Amphidinium_carterae.1
MLAWYLSAEQQQKQKCHDSPVLLRTLRTGTKEVYHADVHVRQATHELRFPTLSEALEERARLAEERVASEEQACTL